MHRLARIHLKAPVSDWSYRALESGEARSLVGNLILALRNNKGGVHNPQVHMGGRNRGNRFRTGQAYRGPVLAC